jgi:hypothetical protein
LISAASSLGWEETIWGMSQGKTTLYAKKWSDLSEEEKAAANLLCHFDVTWPGGGGESINLLNWNDPVNDAGQSLARVSILLAVLVIVVL